MNILMTGGSGMMGTYILRELLRGGHTVTSYDRVAPSQEDMRFIEGDVNSLDGLKKACPGHDAIIHLAAATAPGRATPAEMLQLNTIGTLQALEAAVQTGVRKVVLASSGSATGFTFQKRKIIPRYLPLDEEHPCEPQDEYGLSKLLAELTCRSYSDSYGIQTICLRINNNWYLKREHAEAAMRLGWGRKLGSAEALWRERYLKSIEDPDGAGDWPVPGPPAPPKILWAFTDARDAAGAFRLAVENDEIVHDVFFINGDETCSTVETRALIARHYPDVPLKAPLEGHASLWSHEKATRMLGYRPEYTWRDSDFAAWLESRSG